MHRDLFSYLKACNPELKIDAKDIPVLTELAQEKIYPVFFPEGTPDSPLAIVEPNTFHTNENPFYNPPFNNRSELIKGIIDAQINCSLEEMQEIFATKPESLDSLIPKIARGLLSKDYNYLVDPGGGRPRGQKSNNGSLVTDPYTSYFIDYALLGRKTDREEFNTMFGRIKNFVYHERSSSTDTWSTKIEPQLTPIITNYNNYHPKKKFALPALA